MLLVPILQNKQIIKMICFLNFIDLYYVIRNEVFIVEDKNAPPILSLGEEIMNAITHGLGALFAIIGIILLLLKSDTTMKIIAALIYGISLFVLMLMSCLYHSFKSNSKVKRLWRRFDYMSIYLLIAGTFAPLLLVYIDLDITLYVFIIQWILTIVGIVFISVFGPGKFSSLHFTLYFVIGWSGLMFVPYFYTQSLSLLIMIFIGGLAYTLGMIPFTMNKKYCHALWHVFVLIGAITHFVGIYLFVY